MRKALSTTTKVSKFSPFLDFEENPVLMPGSGFDSKAAFNPAVVKEGDDYLMLYRAESLDDGLTGRIGLARSQDGINFARHPEPVIVPDQDFDRSGCEDPRLIKIDDTYYLTYVGNCGRCRRHSWGWATNICLATSKDLMHWEKHGPILKPQQDWNRRQVKSGAILPERINEKYILYFMGETEPWKTAIGLAYSNDLVNWYEPVNEPVLLPREGYFDSQGVEPGPPPLLTKEGIWLIYSGWAENCVYKVGAALLSKEDPSVILERSDKPILAAKDWGKAFGGIANHAVAEALVKDENRWLLYYGAADRACCLAIWEER
jgi:predicted GH43/DUF377 family glycosyl hydrolase